jgi:hypothetical protein
MASLRASSSSKTNFTNLALRIFQLFFGIVTVTLYATMFKSKLNQSSLDVRARLPNFQI